MTELLTTNLPREEETTRRLTEADMLKDGATLALSNNKIVLRATDEQITTAKQEMDIELCKRDLAPFFEKYGKIAFERASYEVVDETFQKRAREGFGDPENPTARVTGAKPKSANKD